MDVTNITMEEVEKIVSPLHDHPLIPFTGFDNNWCKGCYSLSDNLSFYFFREKFGWSYIYGGYRCNCNEPGCERAVFHKECAKALPEINHSSHPHHPLKLTILDEEEAHDCSLCTSDFRIGYFCSICDFKLDFVCALRRAPYVIPKHSSLHKHPLHLYFVEKWLFRSCKACDGEVGFEHYYDCQHCSFIIHQDCLDFGPEAYHTSHPQHPLKPSRCQVPGYADKKCLLCEKEFDRRHHQLHHCDVCNFSICRRCMKIPPPIGVESSKTHEHQLHLFPRLIKFTCNACGTLGYRSPYFCLPCNFMIHRECIGLPRVININRHDDRISYTHRLGHGNWKCRVCREKVDGFYGGYTCSKCPSFSVHARCATRRDVWDMVELEGTPEEEIIAPFEEIDDNTIKHFGHDHNLKINKDGMIQPESTLCVACVFQICSEPFYRCEECHFILHEKCANLPRKKRHVLSNQPFTLHTNCKAAVCSFCDHSFTGFRYKDRTNVTLDVRCASIPDSIEHESHPHPLYYSTSNNKRGCSRCGKYRKEFFHCVECDYILDVQCAVLPKKIMINRYDDHPLFLSYGDMNIDEKYWCEACETKVDPKEGFYTCNYCGVVLHISCVVGDFSYIIPGSSVACDIIYNSYCKPMSVRIVSPSSGNSSHERVEEVVPNTSSICRLPCSACKYRCRHPSTLKVCDDGVDTYICSFQCCMDLASLFWDNGVDPFCVKITYL